VALGCGHELKGSGPGGASGAGALGAGGSRAGASGDASAGGSGGTSGSGGQPGTGGQPGGTGTGGQPITDLVTCLPAQPNSFYAEEPTVLILTDRGSSSFDAAPAGSLPTTGTFFNVRAAVEDAIGPLASPYSFGLGVYVGDNSSGSCQLGYASVPFQSYSVQEIYNGYEALGPLPGKADTPASAALAMAKATLSAGRSIGSKFLLFITNGSTDFCDEGPADCATDAVTSELQAMYAGTPSIETLVVGVPTASSAVTPGALSTFANAGAGQPASFATSDGESQSTLYGQCMSASSQWLALFDASGKTAPAAIGSYSAAGGTAPLYMAASNSKADIETQVKAALKAAKSCLFGITTFSIKESNAAEGSVTISGVSIPFDGSNGWSLPSSSEILLNGAACASWRQPNATISFYFPCDAIGP
jgi:hypothetical protein